jgi:hypothetical protein
LRSGNGMGGWRVRVPGQMFSQVVHRCHGPTRRVFRKGNLCWIEFMVSAKFLREDPCVRTSPCHILPAVLQAGQGCDAQHEANLSTLVLPG